METERISPGNNLRLANNSPLHELPRLGDYLSVSLYTKRDDLLPFVGGGNKVRKMWKISADVEAKGCNAIVTTGGMQSNHARVAALTSAMYGWKLFLVLHGNASNQGLPKGNLLLMYLTEGDIKIVEPTKISQTINSCILQARQEGFEPYLIPGGGHCLTGAMAYLEAVLELKEQCDKLDWYPEWIIHASGTGTTQAGLLAGINFTEWKTKVVGISVARRNPSGKEIIEHAYEELCSELKIQPEKHLVDFRDEWVGEGYEKAGPEVFSAIRMAAEMEGLILDPTYTGKAFKALIDIIKSGEIKSGSKVLFWHTGGLLNLMASPYVEDILKS